MKVKEGYYKYKNGSAHIKATIWYTVCNVLQKLAAFIIIPFLTRILTVEEYGMYTVFLSWLDIFEVFATMKMYSNGYVAGLVKNEENSKEYICSIQFISIVTIFTCWVICMLLSPFISAFVGLEMRLINMMFLSFIGTSSIGIWSATQRVNGKYKMMVIATLLYSVVAPITSIVFSMYLESKLTSVIYIRIIVQFLVSLPFLHVNLFGRSRINLKYCYDALRYNMPLIIYYLSMVLLNNSDRIMIQKMVGEKEAAIYSVAYSLSMAVFVFSGALNLAIQPWLFKQLKTGISKNLSNTISVSILIVMILNTGILVISPELITIVASNDYSDAIWVMPPIIISLLVMFVYQQFLNIHFYYGENIVVFVASVFSALFNMFLNYVFINIFGYIAAGYTTLVSYSVVAVLYYITMKKICKKHGIDYRKVFNEKAIVFIIMFFVACTVVLALFYTYPVLRYALVGVVGSYAIIKHRKLRQFIKSFYDGVK